MLNLSEMFEVILKFELIAIFFYIQALNFQVLLPP